VYLSGHFIRFALCIFNKGLFRPFVVKSSFHGSSFFVCCCLVFVLDNVAKRKLNRFNDFNYFKFMRQRFASFQGMGKFILTDVLRWIVFEDFLVNRNKDAA
jgi:hypothetical protein